MDAAAEVEVLTPSSAVAELSGMVEGELLSGEFETAAASDVSDDSSGVKLGEAPADGLERPASLDAVSDINGVGADGTPGREKGATAMVSTPKLKVDSLEAVIDIGTAV